MIRLVCPFCSVPWAVDEHGVMGELAEEPEICPECSEGLYPVGDELP